MGLGADGEMSLVYVAFEGLVDSVETGLVLPSSQRLELVQLLQRRYLLQFYSQSLIVVAAVAVAAAAAVVQHCLG